MDIKQIKTCQPEREIKFCDTCDDSRNYDAISI